MKKILLGIGSFFTLTLPMLVLAAKSPLQGTGPFSAQSVVNSANAANSASINSVAAANNAGNFGKVNEMIIGATGLLRSALVLLIALAVVWFIWNVIKYSMSGEEDGKEKAKEQMIHGIIAIAVIVSIWGIVAILQSMFISGGNSVTGVNNNLGGMIPGQ